MRSAMYVKRCFTILFMLLFCLQSLAQDSTSVKKAKKTKKVKILPFPVIGSSPTTGPLIGIAPGAYWMLGDSSNTSLSSAIGSFLITSKKQILMTAKGTTYFKGDQWTMMTDIRYFITSQGTYGLGTGPQSAKPVSDGFIEYTDNPYKSIPDEQMMEFDFIRFHNTLLRRYKDTRFFGGFGYHLDLHENINDHLLDTSSTPKSITSHYAYSVAKGFNPEKYELSGVSLNFMYDSRDNGVNPYSGRYALISFRMNPKFLGSSKQCDLLWMEYRDYFHLSKTRQRNMIAFWTYGWFVTRGQAPYLDLPSVGWDQFGRSGRAYTQGRFRGEQLVYHELEWRVPLQRKKDLLGAVVFVNGTSATNEVAGIKLYEYLDVGYGAGFRVMISKKTRANVNVDYAFGKYGASGLYLNINEVF